MTLESVRSDVRSEAERLLQAAVEFDELGEPCGTVASTADPSGQYRNVWTRDNVAPCLYFLRTDPGFVRRFLEALMRRQSTRRRTRGLIPIGFSPRYGRVDFGGEEAIGAIHSMDSTLWFLILLGLYVETIGDLTWLAAWKASFRSALDLVLAPRFDPLPLVAAPESVTEIDRPIGLHGYPVQLQILACLALRWSARLLVALGGSGRLAMFCRDEAAQIETWINRWYWLDRRIVAERLELPTERHGPDNPNPFNVDYAIVAEEIVWIGDNGFLAGTVRGNHIDTRFWSFANGLAASAGILHESRAAALVRLIGENRSRLVARVPLAVCWPYLEGDSYRIVMSGDPRGRPGQFHNGAHWPNITWTIVPATLRSAPDLAAQLVDQLADALPPHWGEFYQPDGRLGEGARSYQTWSIAGYLVSEESLRAGPGGDYWQPTLVPSGGW